VLIHARKLERAQIDLQLEQLATARARRRLIEACYCTLLLVGSVAFLVACKLIITGAL